MRGQSSNIRNYSRVPIYLLALFANDVKVAIMQSSESSDSNVAHLQRPVHAFCSNTWHNFDASESVVLNRGKNRQFCLSILVAYRLSILSLALPTLSLFLELGEGSGTEP